jgi:hypothetical protein
MVGGIQWVGDERECGCGCGCMCEATVVLSGLWQERPPDPTTWKLYVKQTPRDTRYMVFFWLFDLRRGKEGMSALGVDFFFFPPGRDVLPT